MSTSSKTVDYSPFPAHESEWNIRDVLRYEFERSQVVSAFCDWESDVPRKIIDALLDVLKGGYPSSVYLAERPRPAAWTRKIKLFFAGMPGEVITVIGGGTPRLWSGNEVAYHLPNPDAHRPSFTHHFALRDGFLVKEDIGYAEVQGGLALPLSVHIHKRMNHASGLLGNSGGIPAVLIRGQFVIPRWKGGFLVYREPLNHHPAIYLHRGKHGDSVFLKGVESLFRLLQHVNREMFNGDLVRHVNGGSANLGFTPDGAVVVRGWGRRFDERVPDWPQDDLRKHRMCEVLSALAGLIGEILNSGRTPAEQRHLIIDTVKTGVESYTGRQKTLDSVGLAVGLPNQDDLLGKYSRIDVNRYHGTQEYLEHAMFHTECGQLPDRIKQWLIECVEFYL